MIQGTGSNYKSKFIFINESGLYSLILSSKLPQAKEFKRWVTSEGLPQITQNGVKIGQTRLFYWLRFNGYLFKKKAGRRPIQKLVEMDKRL